MQELGPYRSRRATPAEPWQALRLCGPFRQFRWNLCQNSLSSPYSLLVSYQALGHVLRFTTAKYTLGGCFPSPRKL